MIARGFRPVGWVVGVAAAALGCYMLSLQVAAERAELAGVERRIVAAQQNIRALQTELGTRGRLQQLERWNSEVLALSAPVAGQFLDSEVVLARFDTRHQGFGEAEIRMAAADTSGAVPAAVRQASAEAAAPVVQRAVADYAAAGARTAEEEREAAARPPLVRRAALVIGDVAPDGSGEAAPPARRNASAGRPAGGLLDDRLLAEIGAAARAERASGN